MKHFKNAIKNILLLISYIGPIILVVWIDLHIVLKVIIAGITFLYNALYHYRTEGIRQELSDLKYSYDKKIKQYEEWQKRDSEYLELYKERLDEAFSVNERLAQELNKHKQDESR